MPKSTFSATAKSRHSSIASFGISRNATLPLMEADITNEVWFQALLVLGGFVGAVVGGAWLNGREVRRGIRLEVLRNILPRLILPPGPGSFVDVQQSLYELVRLAMPLSHGERKKVEELVAIADRRWKARQPPSVEVDKMTPANRALHQELVSIESEFKEKRNQLYRQMARRLRAVVGLSDLEKDSISEEGRATPRDK